MLAAFFQRTGNFPLFTLCACSRAIYHFRFIKFALGSALALLSMVFTPSFSQDILVNSRINEQVVMIYAAFPASVNLETTIFRPPGNGPFPLLIMNHGKDAGNPHAQKRDRFFFLSKEFVKRGYAVIIPMRKGFSKSSGDYEDFGCDMTANGQLQADDLQNTLEYARGQTWVDKNRIIVGGQSYGGLATMALGARNYPGVRGLLNFAGGLRNEDGNCHWQESLVKALATYGAHSSVPSLWFYGENDKYFSQDIAIKMHNAYLDAGGNAKLIAYGPFKKDAHGMAGSRDGVKIWWPETEKFLRQIDMPAEITVRVAEDAPIPKSNFAAIENIEAIPFLQEAGREAYKAFLSKSLPKAFAVSPSGVWSWAEEGENPMERVLATCQLQSSLPCQLYAVDNYVVWSDSNPADNIDKVTASK